MLADGPVDPVVPVGYRARFSDGSDLSAVEQGMLVSEPAATFPPGTAAVRTPQRQLAIHIRAQDEDTSLTCFGAHESFVPDRGGVGEAKVTVQLCDEGESAVLDH